MLRRTCIIVERLLKSAKPLYFHMNPLMNSLQRLLLRTPLLWRVAHLFESRFPGSVRYWESRYQDGGNSGAGSYGALAQFKADFLNSFVIKEDIQSVIEFGCGDGAQLALAVYPHYVGLDVTKSAVKMCIEKNHDDASKSFFLYDAGCFSDIGGIFRAELSLSLDVIYHLIEDAVFDAYMNHLFGASTRFVVIYSSDHEEIIPNAHVRHRNFSTVVETRFQSWKMVWREPQRYPDASGQNGSFCDFFVFKKRE